MLSGIDLLQLVLLLLLLQPTMLWSGEHTVGSTLLQAMNPSPQKDNTEQIWRELNDRLRQFVHSRIRSTTDVDDIIQTVFLRIHSGLADLRNSDRIEAWVFQIARNAVTDHFRNKRDAHDDVDSLLEKSTDGHTDNVTVELSGCLNSFIERLPVDQRRALAMYELQGRSQKDISEIETISVSGAKSRIQRGRKSLERMLRECCEFDFDRRGNIVDYKTLDQHCCDKECS